MTLPRLAADVVGNGGLAARALAGKRFDTCGLIDFHIYHCCRHNVILALAAATFVRWPPVPENRYQPGTERICAGQATLACSFL
jgi:hypothetical protein